MLFYVASPYWHKKRKVRKSRTTEVTYCTSELVDAFPEYAFFSPIVYTTRLEKFCLRQNIDWYKFDLIFLHVSHALIVVKIPGWEESFGVQLEINEAKLSKRSIPIFYLDPKNPVEDLEKSIQKHNLFEKWAKKFNEQTDPFEQFKSTPKPT